MPLFFFCSTELVYEYGKEFFYENDTEYKLKMFWLISYICMIPGIIKYRFYRFIPGITCAFISIISRFYMEHNNVKHDLNWQIVANTTYIVFKLSCLTEMILRKYFIMSIYFLISVSGTIVWLGYLFNDPLFADNEEDESYSN